MIQRLNVDQLYPRWLVARENNRPFHLIDVRNTEEYSKIHVPGARLISLHSLMAKAGDIPKDGDVYLICHSGIRSAQAGSFLAQQFGYDNLINIDGGTMAWADRGYPTESGGLR